MTQDHLAEEPTPPPTPAPSFSRSFGRYIRSLRKARKLTQDMIAERSGLSADTIRRLEAGSFSPSLDTLKKLCGGLDLTLAVLFESYELGEFDPSESLRAILRSRTQDEVRIVMSVVYSLIEGFDAMKAGA